MLCTRVGHFVTLFVLTQAQCKHRANETEAHARKIAAGAAVESLDEIVAKSTVSLNNAGGESFCSGTLISPTVVVTAAHCVSTLQSNMPIFIAFGLNVRGQRVDAALSRAISAVVVHPDYRPIDAPPFSPLYQINDVALIKLSTPAPESFAAVPIASEDWALRRDPEVEIAGYGLTKDFIDENGNSVTSSDTGILRRAKGTLADSERWAARTGLVVFSGTNKSNSCRGDSGGPMFGSNNIKLLLIGATMGGGECAKPSSTENTAEGFYTNLTPLRPWIECTSGVDTGTATDAREWNKGRCLTTRKRACAKMKVGPASLPHLRPGRGGLRFNAGSHIAPGTPLEVSLWMGGWVRFTAPQSQISLGFAPVDSLDEDGSCSELAEGAKIKILKSTILKSIPAQGVTLPPSMKSSVAANAILDAAVVRFPTDPGATAQHLIVTLMKPMQNCPVITGFIPENDVEPEFTIP